MFKLKLVKTYPNFKKEKDRDVVVSHGMTSDFGMSVGLHRWLILLSQDVSLFRHCVH